MSQQDRFLTESTVGSPDYGPRSFTCNRSCGRLGAAWVHVAGELDLATAPLLERRLQEAQLEARLVVLDGRDLTFIASAGVHVIVDAAKRARRRDQRLVLIRAPAEVDAIFALTGASDDVEVLDLTRAEPPVQALLALVRQQASPADTG